MVLVCLLLGNGAASGLEPTSKTIAEVLRQPLPPEDLSCAVTDVSITVKGPTFQYAIDRASGTVTGLEVNREGAIVAALLEPAAFRLDDASLANVSGGDTQVLEDGPARVVLTTKCAWAPGLPCTLKTTIYNDGVLVSEITLTPEADVVLRRGIRFEVTAAGRFASFLHKRRDSNGMDCFQGALPKPGETVRLDTPTSCLEAFSDQAALAMFTDMGDFYRSPAALDTAAVRVDSVQDGMCALGMHQHLVHVGPEGTPYTLSAGKPFTFRVGLAVAPNRLPHPRRHDLRMFIWVGDEKFPYPSDEEIRSAARLGYTLFQMHRLGPPGEPRPPAGELDRVLKTVHDAGMLFIWTANADLMYRHDPAVANLVDEGLWSRWQGFNYNGKYKAAMDSFCDTLSTCLASPNGLADYRVDSDRRMLERYPVDGMYIDDNLAYENCTLWKEHGHPQQVYDCLIELHDMNWRRRQVLREGCPHAVLIDHSSHAFVLPVISAFDSHLFGEGYTFPSVDSFRATFGTYGNMYAQGCLWAGDTETTRCGAQTAYAFDLLTGGGQYSYLDWRLWPDKFPYASGVSADEPLFVRTYNLAQYNFGMYESEFTGSLATTVPGTYAALYHNRVWNDVLAVIANMNEADVKCSLSDPAAPQRMLGTEGPYVVYDVHQRALFNEPATSPFVEIALRPHQTRLFYLRTVPEGAPYHLWGGKRITEHRDPASGGLAVQLQGPEGQEDWIVLGTGGDAADRVLSGSKPAAFSRDTSQGLLYGKVTFGRGPLLIETKRVRDTPEAAEACPEIPIEPDDLTRFYAAPLKDCVPRVPYPVIIGNARGSATRKDVTTGHDGHSFLQNTAIHLFHGYGLFGASGFAARLRNRRT